MKLKKKNSKDWGTTLGVFALLVVLFVMATRKMHALVQVYLTTANQSEICVAYLALCLFWRRAYRVWKMNRQIMVEFFIMNETMIFAQKSDEKRQL